MKKSAYTPIAEDKTTPKKPGLLLSLVPVFTVLILLFIKLLAVDVDIQIPLLIASTVAGILSTVVLKNPWSEIEQGIFKAINNAMQAILIACIIGLIIGSWISGGIVPSLIYYGLKIVSPKFFLVTCLIVCSIVSISIGSSWTTAGTLGVAMLGIGTSMGLPPALIAGCIVSGAYFGDKMSPFSDTTNLAPAVSGTTLFAHIRHMMYTTGTSYAIAVILYAIINLKFVAKTDNEEKIRAISSALKSNFTISPLLLIPLLLLLLMIYFKIPAIPGLIAGVALGCGCAYFVQGRSLEQIGTYLSYGYTLESNNEMLNELLSKGGLQNMMWTVSLILCSLTFGGIMFSSGMLQTIAESILKHAHKNAGLIVATGLTAFIVNIVCGEQYLSILLTGRMYKDEYEKRNLAPQNLSRTLEDFGTVTSPLIPWTTCAVAMSTYLGISTTAYLPYAFFNIINPIVAIIFAITGFSIFRRDQVSPEDIIETE